jgi:hypothetical protein
MRSGQDYSLGAAAAAPTGLRPSFWPGSPATRAPQANPNRHSPACRRPKRGNHAPAAVHCESSESRTRNRHGSAPRVGRRPRCAIPDGPRRSLWRGARQRDRSPPPRPPRLPGWRPLLKSCAAPSPLQPSSTVGPHGSIVYRLTIPPSTAIFCRVIQRACEALGSGPADASRSAGYNNDLA